MNACDTTLRVGTKNVPTLPGYRPFNLNIMKRRKPPITPQQPVADASGQQSAVIKTNAASMQTAFALHQQGQLDQAQALYQEILQSQPQHFDALQLLASIALQRHDLITAVTLLEQALNIDPNQAGALNNLGNALLLLQNLEAALHSYDRALAQKPDFADALYNRGAALLALKRPEQALQSFDRVLALQANHPPALNNRGAALLALNRLEAALDNFNRALALQPDFAEALNNRGNALRNLNRPEQALQSFDRALALQPDFAEALNNRGFALRNLKRHQQALENFHRAQAVKADYADAHWNEGLCRLLIGDFAVGWEKYEWRWKKEPQIHSLRNFKQPLWLGKEDLNNKTILLHSEQGLGDTLQFCRYAGQVAALGAKVILEVQPSLKLLLNALEGVATVLSQGENLPYFDCHCPLLSLPLALKTELNTRAKSSYLTADPDKITKWQAKLATNKKKVGLVWRGNPAHKNDHNRSIPLAAFKALIDDKADYFCLQYELAADDKAILEKTSNIRLFEDDINDFSDTAALVELMDLVITVDTSMAHLAGALGKAVWILLPFDPDWRWLLDRSDSPWYPSAKLFRQPNINDWETVILDVKTALTAYAAI